MKKHIITTLITCFLILVLSSAASVTQSTSTSEPSNTSNFPVNFDLSTIDWTAVSSLLTVVAIYVSIKANKTAQDAIHTTISIQKQATGLSMMQKRVSIIGAVRSNNFSSIQENDILYYFDENCLALYKKYKHDYRNSQYASRQVENYFKDLAQQYINQLDAQSDIQNAIAEIDQYEDLTMYNPNDEALDSLAQKYQLHHTSITSDGEFTDIFFTYDDVCNNCRSSDKISNESKNNLITALEKILYQSLELPDN